jgi:hypothetical protein
MQEAVTMTMRQVLYGIGIALAVLLVSVPSYRQATGTHELNAEQARVTVVGQQETYGARMQAWRKANPKEAYPSEAHPLK